MRYKVNAGAPSEIMGRKPDKKGEISLTRKQAEYYLRNGHVTEVDDDDEAKAIPAAKPAPALPKAKPSAEPNGL